MEQNLFQIAEVSCTDVDEAVHLAISSCVKLRLHMLQLARGQ